MWSYSKVQEYTSESESQAPNKQFLVFDQATGGILDPTQYQLKMITIQINHNTTFYRMCFSRWKLMEVSGKYLNFEVSDETGNKFNLQVPIKLMQQKIRENPDAELLKFHTSSTMTSMPSSSSPISSAESACVQANQFKQSYSKQEVIIDNLTTCLPLRWQYNTSSQRAFVDSSMDRSQLMFIQEHFQQHAVAEKIQDFRIDPVEGQPNKLRLSFRVLDSRSLEKIPALPYEEMPEAGSFHFSFFSKKSLTFIGALAGSVITGGMAGFAGGALIGFASRPIAEAIGESSCCRKQHQR